MVQKQVHVSHFSFSHNPFFEITMKLAQFCKQEKLTNMSTGSEDDFIMPFMMAIAVKAAQDFMSINSSIPHAVSMSQIPGCHKIIHLGF